MLIPHEIHRILFSSCHMSNFKGKEKQLIFPNQLWKKISLIKIPYDLL